MLFARATTGPQLRTPHRAAEPAFHPLRVAEVRRETPDAVSVRFVVPPGLAPESRFRPGQHVQLRARIDDAELRRPYSICSGVADGELPSPSGGSPCGSCHATLSAEDGDETVRTCQMGFAAASTVDFDTATTKAGR